MNATLLINDGFEFIMFVLILLLIVLSPAIILVSLGFYRRKSSPENTKWFFIGAGIYLLIGAGYCGSMFLG